VQNLELVRPAFSAQPDLELVSDPQTSRLSRGKGAQNWTKGRRITADLELKTLQGFSVIFRAFLYFPFVSRDQN
jgi:hypothetical protein